MTKNITDNQETDPCTVHRLPCTSIELRSEEMQDILTRPPHILVRSGISVICAVIFILLTGSFFFSYPDIVTGEITITYNLNKTLHKDTSQQV